MDEPINLTANGSAAPQLTNSRFLLAAYGDLPQGQHGWVCAFNADPNQAPAACWAGRPYKGLPAQAGLIDRAQADNAYFCTAVLTASGDGEIARSKSAFKRLAVLLADDAKLEGLRGTPTYVFETSPGKFQAGVILDPLDEDAADGTLVDAVMHELAKQGALNDTSGNSRVRYGRLPLGANTKSRHSGVFAVRVVRWHPDHTLSLVDAAAVFSIDLNSLRATVGHSTPTRAGRDEPGLKSVNETAMQRLEAWVPVLWPQARRSGASCLISSLALWRRPSKGCKLRHTPH